MKFNFIQSLGISGVRDVFHMGKYSVKIYRQGDVVKDIDEHTYLVEDVRTTSVVLRKLNWWGKLLLKFGWLV